MASFLFGSGTLTEPTAARIQSLADRYGSVAPETSISIEMYKKGSVRSSPYLLTRNLRIARPL